MSNIVTYEARFNEKDFTRGAQNIFTQVNQINQAVNQTNTFIGSLGNAFGDAVARFRNLTDVVNNMNGAFSSIAAPGLEAGTQLRNMTTLFRGNAEEAQDMYDRIAEYGKDVKIYDKGTLLEAQKTMMSFGVDAEKSFGALKNIGDIAMGDGQKMQSLSLAFAQATSTGKLMGQDLMQMINAGFNPLQVISERTGESMESLKDKMSNGEISADMLAQAFQWATDEQGQFYQGAENAGDTPAGKLAELRNKMDDLKTSLFESAPGLFTYAMAAGEIGTQITPLLPLFQGIGSLLGGVVGVIGSISKFGILRKIVSLKTGLVGVIGKVQMLGVKMSLLKLEIRSAGGPWMFFKKMGEMACRGVSSAVKSIPIVGWIAIVIGVIIGAAALLREHIDSVTRFMQTSFGKVLSVVFPIINVVVSIAKHWDSIKTAFTDGGIIAGLKRIGFVLLDAMLVPIQNLLELVSKIPGIGNLAAGAAAKIAQVRQNLDKATYVAPKAEKEEKTENGGGIFQPVVTPTGGTPKTVKKNTESIATGGTRSTTVNITIGDMIKQCVFNGSVNENVDNVADKFAEALNRALGIAYATAKV